MKDVYKRLADIKVEKAVYKQLKEDCLIILKNKGRKKKSKLSL